MKAFGRRRVAIALAIVAALSVLSLAAGDAAARAGSGGSRGSRSSSTPARPSSPASPTTPSSPSRTLTQPSSPAPVQRPGFGGGLLGGLAGFALGGLLGSMLFGGMGHGFGGGFGLLELLLVGGGLYLLFRMMRGRREPVPAYAPSGGGGAPLDYGVEMPAGQSELDRGVAHICQMDPAFDPVAVAGVARDTFAAVQAALTARDLAPVAGRLTSRMYTELTEQCDRLRAARQTNRVEQIEVRRAEVTEAWQEGGADWITVYLGGSLADYTLDDASGGLLDGSRSPQDFEEFWTFTRPVGPHPWKLSAIQTG